MDQNFSIVNYTLTSALATAGTITPGYPTGFTEGDFRRGRKHVVVVDDKDFYYAPEDFTIALGDSTFTLTWKASNTLPADSVLRIQLDRPGLKPIYAALPRSRPSNVGLDTIAGGRKKAMHATAMTPVWISFGTPAAADANGYVESQDLTAVGVFSTDTTAAAAIAAAALDGTPDVPRNVVAAWTGTAVLTVTGKDVHGQTMKESSGSGTSFTGKKAFAEITDVSVSANVTGLTVGTGDVLGFPVYIPDDASVLAVLKDGVPQSSGIRDIYLTGRIADVSSADQIYLPCPVAGEVKAVYTVLNGAITGGNATITVKTAAGTVGTITVANSGSAAGDVDSLTSGLNNATVAAGATIEVETDGGSTTTVGLDVTVVVTLTDGITPGVDVAPTATTGDVRGTFEPNDAPDGSIEYAVIALLDDPTFAGGPQYDG